MTTHCRSTVEKCSARCADGSAMFITVRSSTTISCARPITHSSSQRRRSRPPPAIAASAMTITLRSLANTPYVDPRRRLTPRSPSQSCDRAGERSSPDPGDSPACARDPGSSVPGGPAIWGACGPVDAEGGSWGQRGQQGGRVIAATVNNAVDEQGRRAEHLVRGQAAVDIPADPVGHALLVRSRSNAATSRPSRAAYLSRSAPSSAFCRWNSSSCMSQNRSCSAAASAAAAAARACGWMPVSGKWRNANRMFPPSCCSTRSIA